MAALTDEERKHLVTQARANVPFMIELAIIHAAVHRAKFNALVKEGFTEAQALELAKTVP